MNQSVIESALANTETVLRFEPGEELFREGEEPKGVLILHSGEVDLLFAARNGNMKALRVALPGQLLGLSCVVAHRPHDCTATARTACQAGFVAREDLQKVLEAHPAVWFGVLSMLSTDINAAYEDMRTLVAR